MNAEIEEMAARFKIPVDQWLKMLKQERNVSPEQYADDIIWPTIALRKLAGEQLKRERARRCGRNSRRSTASRSRSG